MSHHLKFLIDGRWVEPAVPVALDVIDPATEEAFTQIALGSAEDVDRAFLAARAAFPAFSLWSKDERLALLRRILAAYEARYFDLALVGWSSGNPGIQMLAEAVIFGSGRPTIIVPEGAEASGISRIAIAWDGSRVAARALADATRLLERAEEMHVITVTDEKPLADKAVGDRLAEGLRQAGVKASFSPIRAEDCPIAETLQRHALELDAQLLVMGGYGHSRLRDFVLGGATAGVLRDLRMPILLSH